MSHSATDCSCPACSRSRDGGASFFDMNRLAPELKARIASYLDRKNASRLSRVDRAWHEAAAAPLWTEIQLSESGNLLEESIEQQYIHIKTLRRQPELCTHVRYVGYCGVVGSVMPLLADTLELVGPHMERLNFSWSGEEDLAYCLRYFRLRLLDMDPFTRLHAIILSSVPSKPGLVFREILALAPNLTTLNVKLEYGNDTDEMESGDTSKWPLMPNLTHVTLAIDFSGLRTVIGLLKKCPRLLKLDLNERQYDDDDEDDEGNEDDDDDLSFGQNLHPTLEYLRLPITHSMSKILVQSLLDRLSDSPCLKVLELGASTLEDFDQIVFTVPSLETIIVWEYGFYMEDDLFPIIPSTIRQYLGYFARHPFLVRILFSISSRSRSSSMGYTFENQTYDAILLRSYHDPSTHETLYHFRYTERRPWIQSHTVHPSKDYTTLDQMPHWRPHHRRWTSCAVFRNKPVDPVVLSSVYAMIEQKEKWKEPGRNLQLPKAAWTALRGPANAHDTSARM